MMVNIDRRKGRREKQTIAEKIWENLCIIYCVELIEVFDCHNIMARSYLSLTGSGGIQEDVLPLGKLVLAIRDITEMLEGVEAGTLKLVGTDEETTCQSFKYHLKDVGDYNAM